MRTLFKKKKKELYGISLILVIFGLLLIILNTQVLTGVLQIIGYALCALGAILIIYFLFRRGNTFLSTLVIGILCVIIGYFFARDPATILSMSSTLIGLVLIVNGILHMRTSLHYHDYYFPQWKGALIYGILVILVGIVFIMRPMASLMWILRFSGAALVVEGMAIAYGTHSFASHLKQNPQFIEGEFTEKSDKKENQEL